MPPAATPVEADNRQLWKGVRQGGKERRMACSFHLGVSTKVELERKPMLLAKGIQRQELPLEGVLVQIGKDRFYTHKDSRELFDQSSQFLQTALRLARVKP